MAARVFAVLALVASASAARTLYSAYLDGQQQNPAVTTNGQGWGSCWYDDVTLQVNLTAFYHGLSSNIAAAHVHGPVASIGVDGAVLWGFTAGSDFSTSTTSGQILPRVFDVTTHATELATQKLYYNVHSANFGNGEIRGQLYQNTWRFTADLSGAQQNPAVTVPSRGKGWVTITPPSGNNAAQMTFSAHMWALSGPVTIAHFHRGWKGINGNVIVTLTSYIMGDARYTWIAPTTLTLLEDDYHAFIRGEVYFNFHTGDYPSGELRGQVWMSQGVDLASNSYMLNTPVPAGSTFACKARTTAGVTNYEGLCMKYNANGMATIYHATFADAACKTFVDAYMMDATLINAGVNQFLQRDTNPLDRFLVYPWNITYATISSAVTGVTSYGACNDCAGDTLRPYSHYTVRRSCGLVNAGKCPLLGSLYMNGYASTTSAISFTGPASFGTNSAWVTAAANNDVTYSPMVVGSCADFLAAFPKSGASAVVPSMLVVVLAALVALFH